MTITSTKKNRRFEKWMSEGNALKIAAGIFPPSGQHPLTVLFIHNEEPKDVLLLCPARQGIQRHLNWTGGTFLKEYRSSNGNADEFCVALANTKRDWKLKKRMSKTNALKRRYGVFLPDGQDLLPISVVCLEGAIYV